MSWHTRASKRYTKQHSRRRSKVPPHMGAPDRANCRGRRGGALSRELLAWVSPIRRYGMHRPSGNGLIADVTFHTDPLSHVAARFAHAVEMLVDLIPFTSYPEVPRVVEMACLEDWFTNYRLLIEFLILKPPKNCASAQTFVPGWAVPPSNDLALLRVDYGWASEDVSHIGHLNSVDRGPIDPPTLRLKARRLLGVVEDFSAALHAVDHDYDLMIGYALKSARAALA